MADRQMSGHQYMADRQMADQQMSLPQQVVDFPQYYKRDDFGNYAYGYSNGVLEKFETGNPRSGVKGHYMYVDSNGLNQKVEYVADDQGFRIVNDKHNRFTRSIPDARMSMTSSYLMDDDMLQMQRGMYRNGMSLNNNRRMFDNVMSGNRQMSDRQMYNGQMFDRQMADRQMTGRQMVDRQMVDREMAGDNIMYGNMMNDNRQMSDRQMSDRRMFDREMSAGNVMNGNRLFGMYNMDSAFDKMNMDNMRIGDGVLGEQSTLSQRMEIERIPNTMMAYNRRF